MKFLFLVGSAIKHVKEDQYSYYSEQERFEQTLETIESIKEKVEDPYIVIFECSRVKISDEHQKILEEKCDLFLDLSKDKSMEILYSNLDNFSSGVVFGKSLLETNGFFNCLNYIGENNLFTDTTRIFKLTGRYVLNDDFQIKDYESNFLVGKYILKNYNYSEEEKVDFDPGSELKNVYAYLYGCDGSTITGLWSFDRTLYYDTMNALSKSLRYMEQMIQYTSGIDIEHSLYKFIDKKDVISVNNLGLTVRKGLNGEVNRTYNL
jgi:hypothetical protein